MIGLSKREKRRNVSVRIDSNQQILSPHDGADLEIPILRENVFKGNKFSECNDWKRIIGSECVSNSNHDDG
jgi:hypothetical protein